MKNILSFAVAFVIISLLTSACGYVPPFSILTPQTDTIWLRNKTYNVSWQTNWDVKQVNILLVNEDNGDEYVLANGIHNLDTFNYSVPPNMDTGQYQLRILPGSGDGYTSQRIYITDWDWTVDQTYNIYVRRPDSVARHEVKLPYYSSEGPVPSDISADSVHPKYGWVLLMKKFGTPTDPVVMPRMILYNKFTGKIRLFYFYGFLEESWTHSIVTLKKPDVSERFPAFFTFIDEDGKEFLDEYDTTELTYIGDLQFLVWNYADFTVAGYDPNPPANSKMEFIVSGAKIGTVDLKGTINLTQVMDSENVDIQTSDSDFLKTIGKAFTITKGAWKAYSDTDDWISKKIEETKPGGKKANKFYAPVFQSLGSLADIVPGLSVGISVIQAIFGGGDTPLVFEGKLELSGKIEDRRSLYTFFLRVPGADHTGNDDLPSYNEHLGIYNLVTQPTISYQTSTPTVHCLITDSFRVGPGTQPPPYFLKQQIIKEHLHVVSDVEGIINPVLRDRVAVALAYVPPGEELPDFATLNSDGSVMFDGYFHPKLVTSQKVLTEFTQQKSIDDWNRVYLFKIDDQNYQYSSELDSGGLLPALRNELNLGLQQHGRVLTLSAFMSQILIPGKSWEILDVNNVYYIQRENDVLDVYDGNRNALNIITCTDREFDNGPRQLSQHERALAVRLTVLNNQGDAIVTLKKYSTEYQQATSSSPPSRVEFTYR